MNKLPILNWLHIYTFKFSHGYLFTAEGFFFGRFAKFLSKVNVLKKAPTLVTVFKLRFVLCGGGVLRGSLSVHKEKLSTTVTGLKATYGLWEVS